MEVARPLNKKKMSDIIEFYFSNNSIIFEFLAYEKLFFLFDFLGVY